MAKCKNSYKPSTVCSQIGGKTKGNDDMIELIDNCVDCGKPCMHSACPYYERSYVCCDLCEAVIKPAEDRDYDYEHMDVICDRCYEKIREGVEE